MLNYNKLECKTKPPLQQAKIKGFVNEAVNTTEKSTKASPQISTSSASSRGKNFSRVGILAFQGDVIEHERILKKLGCEVLEVRTVADLAQVDALIIPGGESTVIGFFLEETGLMKAIKERVAGQGRSEAQKQLDAGKSRKDYNRDLPIWGTCAGAIVLAKNIQAEIVPPHLGLMDMTVQRNAYGRQIDSFYTELDIPAIGINGLKAAFIRAPIIVSVQPIVPRGRIFKIAKDLEKNSSAPQILATHERKIVLVQQGNLLASTFHPELTGDTRLHEYFLGLI
ncbi:MAG: pyridoxal 5'-phosphate synthase glutaminase subunit PdxT [Candidatus Gracilibacteria bacterium]|jgi:5'-phosphate synthase pdxT subunit